DEGAAGARLLGARGDRDAARHGQVPARPLPRRRRPGRAGRRPLIAVMDQGRPVLIVNPRSGGGLHERRWARLAGPITDGLGPFDTLFTERPGHARVLAMAEARSGRGLIIAVGGDGTISEVAAGLIDGGGEAALGVIPRGTGG